MGFAGEKMADEKILVVAKYDYKATDAQELNIKKGEKLIVIDNSQHWWKVMNANHFSGYVPSNYVKRVKQGLFSSLKNTLSRKHNKKEFDNLSTASYNTNDSRVLNVDTQTSLFPLQTTGSVSATHTPQHFNSTSMQRDSLMGEDSIKNKLSSEFLNTGFVLDKMGKNSSVGTDLSTTDGNDSFDNDAFTRHNMLEMCIAKFAYHAAQVDELTIAKSDRIVILQKSTDGWWKGRKIGCELQGWFPSNYVVLYDDVDDNHLGTKTSLQVQANHTFFRGGDVDNSSTLNSMHADSSIHKSNDVLFVVKCLYQFVANTDDELDFNEQELLEIIEKPADDPEWWRARNSHGRVGLVPRNYVKLVLDGCVGEQSSKTVSNATGSEDFRLAFSSKNNSLNNKVWYWGNITRSQCDKLLMAEARVGEFVVRNSESNPSDFTVMMHAGTKNRNFKVKIEASGYFVIGQKKFILLDDLLTHYMTHPIYKCESEKYYLTRPFQLSVKNNVL